MRDYALNRAQSFEAAGVSPALSRLLRNWVARRAVSRLDRFDDYMLRDIGVTRDEIQWAANLPLSVNAALALEDRALRRRGVRADEPSGRSN